MSGFSEIQSALASWPRDLLPSVSCYDNSHERLRRVLSRFREDSSAAGVGDLAGLVRHVLRREAILRPDSSPALRVPNAVGWPDIDLWKASDVDVTPQGRDWFHIRASKPWSAEWLPESERVPPLVASFGEVKRRDTWPVSPALPLDPALEVALGLDFQQYSCPGQQQAIRSAFLLSPGGTLVVNLPTGSGKSLVGWAPALMTDQDTLTVMVTPTIALALDQERQLREKYPQQAVAGLPDRLAWHSGLSAAERSEIRTRLFDGTQRILIASPESIVSSLARPLYDAASSGRLKYFIVDEAHLVAQWGIEFRPEFQSMCGLRRELLRHCPNIAARFKTLLLSATLSQECFDILRKLFAEDVFDHVSAVTLRPEPEYWISNARFESVQIDRVVELIRVVPRPFLLYVTTHKQANEWAERLVQMGLRRSDCVHGATPSDVRADVIDRWRFGELDSVVATSAFGLGMDKADVRAVIHACVPESVDRFYQEVGRGGRDGNACVSLMVHTDKDLQTARSISSEKVITIEEGMPRWQAMVDHARRDHESNRLYLNLTQRTPKITGDTAMNNAWNLRTIVLLQRAGLIAIESDRPPEIDQEPLETESAFQSRRDAAMKEYSVTCPVRLLDDGHRDHKVWETRVEPVRQILLRSGWDDFDTMLDIVGGSTELSEILRKVYTLKGDGLHVDPVPVCGGCQSCRTSGGRQFAFMLPEPEAVKGIDATLDPMIYKILGMSAKVVLIACSRLDSLSAFRKKMLHFVLPRLVQLGVREICASEEWQKEKRCRELFRSSSCRFLIHRDIGDTERRGLDLPVARVSLFLPDTLQGLPQTLINVDRPLHVIFAWDDMPERDYPESRFFDKTVHGRFKDLLGRLNQ